MTNEQLVIRIKAGVDVAENMLALWQQNQCYIAAIAKRFRGYEDEEDLTQQGYIGLCNAVSGYNPEEGVPFIKYAGFWIRQSIQRYIEECGSVVRIPTNFRAKIGKYKRLTVAFQAQFGRKPTDQEACYYLRIGYEKLDRIKQAARMECIGSLDVPIGEGEDCSMYDLLPGQESPEGEVVEKLQQEQLAAAIWEAVDTLSEKEAAVLHMRYREGKTLKETGQAMGVTIEQIRQTQNKALRALRRQKYGLQLFLEDGQIYSKALKCNGVEHFNRTWTSSTEYAALGRCW